MIREFAIFLTFDNEPDGSLPDADVVAAVLEHSTAAEALEETTGCLVFMSVVSDPEEIS